ncbi:hypothetical protein LWI29_017846 [Acer saccharum]|uniref:Uncharacterized protein n=1 Tax=Acer saccharum TaxID=4024 RepID=A0AA39SGX2_ACESA|nr:hypothetical protein LWI29_017846 [Acer saccharum]
MDSWCMGGLLCGEGAAADMMVVGGAPAVEGCCDEGDCAATAARDSRRGCRRGISCMTEEPSISKPSLYGQLRCENEVEEEEEEEEEQELEQDQELEMDSV